MPGHFSGKAYVNETFLFALKNSPGLGACVRALHTPHRCGGMRIWAWPPSALPAAQVLNYGWMMQFDTPAKLLSIPQPQPSIFRDLVEETGEASANYLRSVALGSLPRMELQEAQEPKLLPPESKVYMFPYPNSSRPETDSVEVVDVDVVDAGAAEGATWVLRLWFGAASLYTPPAPVPADRVALWLGPEAGLEDEARAEVQTLMTQLLPEGGEPWPGPRGRLAYIILMDQVPPQALTLLKASTTPHCSPRLPTRYPCLPASSPSPCRTLARARSSAEP